MKNRTIFFALFSITFMRSACILASANEGAIKALLAVSPSQTCLSIIDFSTPRAGDSQGLQDCRANPVTPSPKKPDAKDGIEPYQDCWTKPVTPSPKKPDAKDGIEFNPLGQSPDGQASPAFNGLFCNNSDDAEGFDLSDLPSVKIFADDSDEDTAG